MKIILNENDFEQALGQYEAHKLSSEKHVPILGNDDADFFDALPKVIATKVKKLMPKNFKIHQIELKLSIEGKPFGIGCSGDAIVRFGPE